MRYLATFLMIACFDIIQGQSVSPFMAAKGLGMGGVYSTLTDASSILNNAGALAFADQTGIIVSSEVSPLLPGANRSAVGIVMPYHWGTLGASIYRFGDDVYSEQIAGIGYGNRLGIGSLGVRVNAIQYRSSNGNVRTGVSVDFGGVTQIIPGLFVTAYGTNLSQSNLSGQEILPSRLLAGLRYEPNSSWIIATEVQKDLLYAASWRLGIEHSLRSRIFFRTGIGLHPYSYNWGLGGKRNKIKADFAMAFTQATGWRIQASAICEIRSKPGK